MSIQEKQLKYILRDIVHYIDTNRLHKTNKEILDDIKQLVTQAILFTTHNEQLQRKLEYIVSRLDFKLYLYGERKTINKVRTLLIKHSV